MAEAIRVLIAGDDEEECSLIRLVIQQEKDLRVVGLARSGKELAVLLPDTTPHVVLLDLDVPGLDMLDAIKTTRHQRKQMALVGFVGVSDVDEALVGEMDVLLHKRGPLEKLLASLLAAGSQADLVSAIKAGKLNPKSRRGADESAARATEPVGDAVSESDPSVAPVDRGDQPPSPGDGDPAGPAHSPSGDLSPEAPTSSATPLEDVPGAVFDPGVEEMPLPKGTVALSVFPFGSFRSAGVFQQALEALDGVTGVKVRHFHGGTLHQVVQYEGDIPLEERLKELVPFNPRVVASRPGHLEVRIEPGEQRVLAQ